MYRDPSQHLLSIAQTPTATLGRILEVSRQLRDPSVCAADYGLVDLTLALLLEKPSLRTRLSMEQAIFEMGGHAISFGRDEVGLGKRESVGDVTQVVSRMVNAIGARVFDHGHLETMAEHSRVPIINLLSDRAHPLQALADALTLLDEWGPDLDSLQQRHVAFIGDGNNVARSLAMICAKLGIHFTLASPPNYALEDDFAARIMSHNPNIDFTMTHDPAAAVAYADAVYTDTFVSMGQEHDQDHRHAAFEGFQVNRDLLANSPNQTIVLHCLPAHRGIEITDEIMDGPRSRVFAQAENRLHTAKGVLAVLLGLDADTASPSEPGHRTQL